MSTKRREQRGTSREGALAGEPRRTQTLEADLQARLDALQAEHALEIAERKGAEELLARQASVLQEQADLLDLTYDAIVVRGLDGLIRFWNKGAEERYGWRAEEAIGRLAHEFLATRFGDPVDQANTRLQTEGRWEGHLVQTRRDGTEIIMFSRWALQRDDEGRPLGILEINTDITARHKAEERLARQRERLQMLHEIDQAILAAQSPAEIASAVVHRLRQMVPCQRASVLLFDGEQNEARWLAVDAEGDSALGAGYLARLDSLSSLVGASEGQTLTVEDLAAQAHTTREDKILLAEGMRAYASLPLIANGRLIGVLRIAHNTPGPFAPEHLLFARQVGDSLAVAIQNARLNEQVRASRKQLQNLSRRLTDLQESERRSIANELFDDAGQDLSALLIRLRLLQRELASGSPADAQINAIKSLADRTLSDLHQLAMKLRPASLDKLGLLAALRQRLTEVGEQYELDVRLEVVGGEPPRLPPPVETLLYRAVEEALSNVVRHARARHVGLVLSRRGQHILAIVEDDGTGFDRQAAMEHGGVGLFGMRQRLEDLGGTLSVDSALGEGTTVFIDLPVPP